MGMYDPFAHPHPLADPADDWDEDDDYEYDDTKPVTGLDEDDYFAGIGLMIAEDGTIAITLSAGDGVVDFYEVNDTAASGLSAMIDAVLG